MFRVTCPYCGHVNEIRIDNPNGKQFLVMCDERNRAEMGTDITPLIKAEPFDLEGFI